MNAYRPNHNMIHLADAAIDIAARQSRLDAVKFLFDKGCDPEMISRILATCASGNARNLGVLLVNPGCQVSI